jgi:N-acetylneuraminate synthase/N,N'-diacetyllegionaminate synthase
MTGKTIRIADRIIGPGHPAFIIAEAGANHNGDLALAKRLCLKAREIGCDSIKFQTFSAETFCADRTKTFTYRSQGKEVTESEFEMFKRLEFSQEQWAELMAYCDEIGIIFFTTIQDPPNLAMMLELGLKAIKVGSDDFNHVQNLKLYAQTGLPLIISKGMADIGEVDRVIRSVQPYTDQLAVLHCVSLYPTDAKFLNIRQITTLAALYPDIVWGFSDHSLGPLASTLSVALGAHVIEKHFTLDHDLPGPDHWFSMDVAEMQQLVQDVRFAETALGNGQVNPSREESKSRAIMRRRVIARSDLPAGTILDDSSVDFMRAETGCFLEHWELLRGQRLRHPVAAKAGIEFKDVEFADARPTGHA